MLPETEPETLEPVSLPDVGRKQPMEILGHPVIENGDSLRLTSAIDVVFYKGGIAEISAFDLGTDLLWFFLSNEELKSAKNTLTEAGDLVLDFGEIGTLTFLGMVSDISADVAI